MKRGVTLRVVPAWIHGYEVQRKGLLGGWKTLTWAVTEEHAFEKLRLLERELKK